MATPKAEGSGTAPAAAKPQEGLLSNPAIQNILPFLIGGTSGMVATTCIQPVDVVKVRIQLSSAGSRASPFAVAAQIVRDGRFLDLYAGLTAGYLRQATYSTLRLGFFDQFLTFFETRAAAREGGKGGPNAKGKIGFGERAAASLGAGGLAAGISNPVEVALVRMQADGIKPKAERANYRGVFDALLRTARGEGLRGLWAGSAPTIVRAMSTNFGQLAFFSESKAQFERRTEWSPRVRTVAASGVAGFFASLFSLPFDFLKTRLQNASKQPAGGELQYKGMLDCALRVIRDEGPLRFYRGFGTYFFRIAPHSIITLIVADSVTALVKT